MILVLAAKDDDVCAFAIKSKIANCSVTDSPMALAVVAASHVVLVVSIDAIINDAIVEAARAAATAGKLHIVLWRPCVVDDILDCNLDEDGDVRAGKSPVYPLSGRWISGDENRLTEAVAQLARAIYEDADHAR